MKRWNPGCNCCDNLLIWDLGVPRSDGDYGFGHYDLVEEIYDEINIGIDYVTGSSETPDTFYSDTPEFDPY